MKKMLSVFLILLTVMLPLCACGRDEDKGNKDKTLYYLNFKPEIADVYKEIAAKYKEETGVTLNVVTAASGTYEQTLKSEIAKADAPTLFQINGPKGYAAWKNYCADLKDTEIYKHLSDKTLAITDGDGVYGIPYVVEGYGIIYNNAIMDKYFALTDKGTDYQSMDEIRSFDDLRALAEDMTAHKDALGIAGVFGSTSLKAGNEWRWHTHLANVPLYYEFQDNHVDLTGDATKTIEFQYHARFQNLFDLYLNHSTTDKKLLGSKEVADSMAEFALGQCAMIQNGNWAWEQIAQVTGNVVKESDIKMLPVYTGMEQDSKQGICIGTENFLAVNAKASEEKQKLAFDFLNWLYTSETGKDYVINKLGFIAPFDTFAEDETPADPLAKEVLDWMNRDDVTSIPFIFTIFPSQAFKDDFGAALLRYAQGNSTWDEVVSTVKKRWSEEAGG